MGMPDRCQNRRKKTAKPLDRSLPFEDIDAAIPHMISVTSFRRLNMKQGYPSPVLDKESVHGPPILDLS